MTVFAISKAKNNAELIEECAQLGYLHKDWVTLDPTWGDGRFWANWMPDTLIPLDLDRSKSPSGLAVDFRDIRWKPKGGYDAVVFDPPYKYCLDTETEILTRRGWLRYDELSIGDQAYSLDHDTGEARWCSVSAVNVFTSSPTMVMECKGRTLDFVATPNHRWPVLSARGHRRWKTTESLSAGDRLIHAAAWSDTPLTATLSDSLVELVAWFWTEGSVEAASTYGHIAQSHAVNQNLCDRIETAFRSEYGEPVESFERTGRSSVRAWRIRNEERMRRFVFSAAIGAELLRWAPGKVPSLDFLELLTAKQRELFIDLSLQADGQNDSTLAQSDPDRAEAFAFACLLAGRSVSIRDYSGNGRTVRIRGPHTKPVRQGLLSTVRDLVVWCPTVDETSTWLARRNGRIYFTGNSGTPALGAFDERYGIQKYQRWQDREQMILDGISECVRVLRPRGFLLVKCQDQVSSGEVRWQTFTFTKHAEAHGCRLVDHFLLPSYRPQPKGTSQKHARRNYSSLLVLQKFVTTT